MNNQNIILLPDFLDFDVYPFDEKAWEGICTGGNEKGLLVVLNKEQAPDSALVFLTKILSAAKFDLEKDVLLCQLPNDTNIPFQSICNHNEIKHVILFDVNQKQIALNINLPTYQPVQWSNYQILKVDNLSKIEQTKALKGGLWSALKTMFLK